MNRAGRLGAVTAAALLVGACGSAPVEVAVPAGPLAPIVPVAAGEPPVECRGVPMPRCLDFGLDPGPDPDVDGVVRFIVTCTSTCTPDSGDVRIDQLGVDGVISPVARGGYGG